MAAAVCVVGALPFIMANNSSWYLTMSATACVSAADPDRQHQMVSCTCVSLSVTRFAMYAPVVVRESAPAWRRRGVSGDVSRRMLGGWVDDGAGEGSGLSRWDAQD